MVSGKAQERPFSSVPTHPIQLLMAAEMPEAGPVPQPRTRCLSGLGPRGRVSLRPRVRVNPGGTGSGVQGGFHRRTRPPWSSKLVMVYMGRCG